MLGIIPDESFISVYIRAELISANLPVKYTGWAFLGKSASEFRFFLLENAQEFSTNTFSHSKL